MAVDATGPKNEPIFNSNGAPEIDVDPSKVAEYAAKVGNRRAGTTAERLAATGKDVWDGLEWDDTTLDAIYRYKGGGWKLWHKAYTAYTPTVTGITGTAPTLTFGYSVQSGVVEVIGLCQILAGTAVGTGPTFTMPVNAASFYENDADLGRSSVATTGVQMIDAVTVKHSTTNNVLQVYVWNASGVYTFLGQITASVPAAWGAGGYIRVRARYVAA